MCRTTAGQQSCQQTQVVAVSNDSVAGTSSASLKSLVGVGVNQKRGRHHKESFWKMMSVQVDCVLRPQAGQGALTGDRWWENGSDIYLTN